MLKKVRCPTDTPQYFCSTLKFLVEITILRLKYVRHTLVLHFFKHAEPVEVLWAVIVLHMNHHDLLDAGIVLKLFHIAREHMIGTDRFDLLLYSIATP
jgi:hypothetical protein